LLHPKRNVSNGLGSSHPKAVKHDVGIVILPPLIVGLLIMAVILRRFLVICLLIVILFVERSIALLTSSVRGS
jgi:hypothetical protein